MRDPDVRLVRALRDAANSYRLGLLDVVSARVGRRPKTARTSANLPPGKALVPTSATLVSPSCLTAKVFFSRTSACSHQSVRTTKRRARPAPLRWQIAFAANEPSLSRIRVGVPRKLIMLCARHASALIDTPP